jgi:phosphoribosyl-AMP cyclohydrolase
MGYATMNADYSPGTGARRLSEPAARAFADAVAFDDRGLVAAIAQQHDTGEVLMLAWMNRDALVATLTGGRVTYWSRSRQAMWRKGDTSGHIQELVDARIDCDGDTLLLLIRQTGPACHTGAPNCFYRRAGEAGPEAV